MGGPYFALRDLLAQPPYAELSDDAAAEALNTPSIATAGAASLTPDEFVGRFTPAEFAAARDSADPVVRQLMFRLSVRRDPLDLASGTVQGGLAYMAGVTVPGVGTIGAPILTPERAAVIGAVPAGPNITPREQIGWPHERIWPADVLAARKMEG